MKIGAHLSIAGGYYKALERIVAIDGNCLQIFSSSPRGWRYATITNESKQIFKDTKIRLKINEVFFHASYLVNLADEGKIGEKSKESLIAELTVASQLGIIGSIVHLGSFKSGRDVISHVSKLADQKYKTLIDNIKEILINTPQDSFLIIENAGNRKIGQNIDEIASIITDVNNERLKVCLDTCHLFSAGYNLSTKETMDTFFDEFEGKIGLRKLIVFHLNDSKDPFNSGRDRHENIGQGTLSLKPFKLLLNDERTHHLPFIIETPGFNKKGPDKENIDIIKSLV